MVIVSGAVTYFPLVWRPNSEPLTYIEQAGGFHEDAAEDKVLVLRVDGSLIKADRAPSIEPGDLILVPSQGPDRPTRCLRTVLECITGHGQRGFSVESVPLNHLEDEITLGRVLQFSRRWLRFVVLWSLLVGTLVAALVFGLLPRHFSSHFSVFVTGPINAGASAQVQMQVAALFGLSSGGTEYVMAALGSDEIQLAVIDKLQLRTNKDFWWGYFFDDHTPEKTLEQLRSQMSIVGPEPPLQGPGESYRQDHLA